MTYDDKIRIAVEVAGHAPAPADEPADFAAWRKSLERDRDVLEGKGIGFDLPCDWDA